MDALSRLFAGRSSPFKAGPPSSEAALEELAFEEPAFGWRPPPFHSATCKNSVIKALNRAPLLVAVDGALWDLFDIQRSVTFSPFSLDISGSLVTRVRWTLPGTLAPKGAPFPSPLSDFTFEYGLFKELVGSDFFFTALVRKQPPTKGLPRPPPRRSTCESPSIVFQFFL